MNLQDLLAKTEKKVASFPANNRKPLEIADKFRPYDSDTKENNPRKDTANKSLKKNEVSSEIKTNDNLTGNALVTETSFTGNALVTETSFTGNALVTETSFTGNALVTETSFTGNDTDNDTGNKTKYIANNSGLKVKYTKFIARPTIPFISLTGLQFDIMVYIHNKCDSIKSLISPPITRRELSIHTAASTNCIRTSINRLKSKQMLIIHDFLAGKGGWTRFVFPKETFDEISNYKFQQSFKNDSDYSFTGNDTGNDTGNSILPSSSIYINKNIYTTTEEVLSKIDFSELTKFGFSEHHFKQIIKLNYFTAEEIQNSIDAFVFDIEENNRLEGVRNPINLFMGILKNKNHYIPPRNYQKVKSAQSFSNLSKLEQLEFEVWRLKQSTVELEKILKNYDNALSYNEHDQSCLEYLYDFYTSSGVDENEPRSIDAEDVSVKRDEIITVFDQHGYSREKITELEKKYSIELIRDAALACNDWIKDNPNKKINFASGLTKALKENWKPLKSIKENKEDSEKITKEENNDYIQKIENKEFKKVLETLKQEIGEGAFHAWIKGAEVRVSDEENRRIICVDTKFKSQHIYSAYGGKIRRAWNKINPQIEYVDVEVI